MKYNPNEIQLLLPLPGLVDVAQPLQEQPGAKQQPDQGHPEEGQDPEQTDDKAA